LNKGKSKEEEQYIHLWKTKRDGAEGPRDCQRIISQIVHDRAGGEGSSGLWLLRGGRGVFIQKSLKNDETGEQGREKKAEPLEA